VSEVIVTFLKPILFVNTAAFFCSVLGLDSLFSRRQWWEN